MAPKPQLEKPLERPETALPGDFFLIRCLEWGCRLLWALWRFCDNRKTIAGVFLLACYYVLEHEAANWELTQWWIPKLQNDLWFYGVALSTAGGGHKLLKNPESIKSVFKKQAPS